MAVPTRTFSPVYDQWPLFGKTGGCGPSSLSRIGNERCIASDVTMAFSKPVSSSLARLCCCSLTVSEIMAYAKGWETQLIAFDIRHLNSTEVITRSSTVYGRTHLISTLVFVQATSSELISCTCIKSSTRICGYVLLCKFSAGIKLANAPEHNTVVILQACSSAVISCIRKESSARLCGGVYV